MLIKVSLQSACERGDYNMVEKLLELEFEELIEMFDKKAQEAEKDFLLLSSKEANSNQETSK